jgi:hypothetical protein
MKRLSIALAALVLAGTASQAVALSCVVLNPNRYCVNKNPYIDGRYPGYGGLVTCASIQANKVQSDEYVWVGGFGYFYACSFAAIPCSWIQQSDPVAYATFC